MNAGLLEQVDLCEYSCSMTATESRTTNAKGVQANGSFTSTYDYAYNVHLDAVRIELETACAPGVATGSGTASADFECFGNTHTETIAGGFQSISAKIEVDNRRLFAEKVGILLCWVVRWDEIRFIVGGSTVHTVAAGSFGDDIISPAAPYLVPSGDPTASMPRVGAGASMNPVPTFGLPGQNCTVVAADELEVSSTVTGGYRNKFGATWVANPVELDVQSAPSISCDTATSLPVPTMTTTNDAAIIATVSYADETVLFEHVVCDECSNGPASVAAEYDHFVRTISYEVKSGSVWPLPDLDKSVERMGDDTVHGELVYRFGFPETEVLSFATCFDWETETTLATSSITNTVHPSRTDFLGKIGTSVHALEDPFADVSYSGYTLGAYKFEGKRSCFVVTQVGACPLAEEGDPPGSIIDCRVSQDQAISHEMGSQFPSTVEDRVSNPDIDEDLDSTDDYARYVNTVVHPHWSMHNYFPLNTVDTDMDGIVDAQTQWQIDGGPTPYEYFTDMRQQVNDQAALPEGEDTETRNSLVSAPLREGAFSLLEYNRLGVETSWWGITRFIAEEITWDASKALTSASSPAWTLEDCTAVFGANMAVTADVGEDQVVLRYDMGRWTEAPYMFPHICDQIMVAWSGGSIDAVRLYVVDVTGHKEELGNTSGVTYTRPLTATSPQYAGSWAQDFGGIYTTDQGIDTEGEGASLATMAAVERVMAFMLLPGQLSAELRIEVDLTSTGASFTLNYPTFYSATQADSFVTHEQGHHTNIVWPDGPGIRYGNWAWYDDDALTLLSIPKVFNPGYRGTGGWKASAIDWLCFSNVVLRGVAHNTNLAAIAASWFDPDEGSSASDLDTFTLSFIAPEQGTNEALIGIVVNTYRELPPLAHHPVKKRDSKYVENGAYAQEAWSLAQEPRRYMSAKAELHVIDPAGPTTLTATEAGAPSSWFRTKHNTATTGSETAHDIEVGGDKIAEAKPWWGYFAVYDIGDGGKGAANVAYVVGRSNTHYVAYTDSAGHVVSGHSPNTHPLAFDYHTSSFDSVEWIALQWDEARQRLMLWTIEATNLLQRTSTDDGATWSMSTTIASSAKKPCALIGRNNTRYIYWIDGSDIKGAMYDASDSLLDGPFTVVTGGVDDQGLACDERTIGGGRLQVVLWYIASGSLTELYSDDGKIFA